MVSWKMRPMGIINPYVVGGIGIGGIGVSSFCECLMLGGVACFVWHL